MVSSIQCCLSIVPKSESPFVKCVCIAIKKRAFYLPNDNIVALLCLSFSTEILGASVDSCIIWFSSLADAFGPDIFFCSV